MANSFFFCGVQSVSAPMHQNEGPESRIQSTGGITRSTVRATKAPFWESLREAGAGVFRTCSQNMFIKYIYVHVCDFQILEIARSFSRMTMMYPSILVN